MSPALRYVLLLHAAIVVLYLLWRLSAWCEGAASRRAGARRWATLGKAFLVAGLASPLLCAALERVPASQRLLPVEPFAGRIIGEIDGPAGTPEVDAEPRAPASSHDLRSIVPDPPKVLAAIWGAGVLGLLAVRGRQWVRLRSLLAEAVTVRRTGSVEVLVHPEVVSPFATRVRGRATAVVPSFLVETGRWREAVRHELQHHRQGDPRWTLALEAITVLLWVNPAVWCWRRRVLELAELACDESLLERRRVSPAAYGETLLNVAEALSAASAARPGAYCPAMAGRTSPALLARRLERIVNHTTLRRSSMKRWVVWTLAGGVLCAGMAAAWAAGGGTAGPLAAERRPHEGLQKLAEERLAAHLERFSARRGAVVAMDPSTGTVLASAGFRRDAATRKLVPDESVAATFRFLGASTMKPLVVAGALEARVVDASELFDTGDGTLTVGNVTYREWKDGGLGKVSPADVIVKSSNLGVLQIARRLGTERLAEFLVRLGYDVARDAPVEELSLGSYSGVAVTARQMAAAYAAIANGGHAPLTGETVVRTDVSDLVRTALVKAVEEGTGTPARCTGVTVGGKTGTSIREVDGARTGTAFFVGFAPAAAPRLVVCVIVDDVGKEVNGGRHAGPLFREIVENGLPLLAKTPTAMP